MLPQMKSSRRRGPRPCGLGQHLRERVTRVGRNEVDTWKKSESCDFELLQYVSYGVGLPAERGGIELLAEEVFSRGGLGALIDGEEPFFK